MSERLSPAHIMVSRLMDLPGTVGLIGRMDLTVSDLIDALERHGYRIVHPDDVPETDPERGEAPDYYWGWTCCRNSIFGWPADVPF